MKRFYYFLYTFVMAVMLWMVLYGGFTLWQNKNLPSFFYDISTWFAYDELFQHEKVVRGSYHHVENGYYIPQGNTIYALLPGIVIEEENELVMVSDKGIKVIYHFKGNVKKNERVRRNDMIGISEKPIQIQFFMHEKEIDYAQAMAN